MPENKKQINAKPNSFANNLATKRVHNEYAHICKKYMQLRHHPHGEGWGAKHSPRAILKMCKLNENLNWTRQTLPKDECWKSRNYHFPFKWYENNPLKSQKLGKNQYQRAPPGTWYMYNRIRREKQRRFLVLPRMAIHD